MKIKTGSICIQQIMSSNNPLLISQNNCNILIDTGRKNNCNKTLEKLDNVTGNKLNYLILTHAHYDHVENAAIIKEKYGAKIIIHRSESIYLHKGESSPLPAWNYSIGEKINQIDEYKKFYTPAQSDIIVDDLFPLSDLGVDGYILSSPGHTAGSISIILNNEIAITGDVKLHVKKKPFEKKIKRLSNDAIRSWEKMIALNCSVYVTSHNGIMEHSYITSQYNDYKLLLSN